MICLNKTDLYYPFHQITIINLYTDGSPSKEPVEVIISICWESKVFLFVFLHLPNLIIAW